MISELFRPNIDEIHPYEPGKPIEEVKRELGLRSIIKLASNENPLGPPKSVVKAIQQAAKTIALYPDGGQYRLKEALSKYLGVSMKEVVLGNGSNEIIELILRGFVREGDEVITSETSFLVYGLITQAVGGSFIEVPMAEDNKYDLKAIAERITDKTKVIFIANPNNPTGTYVGRDAVREFLDIVPPRVLVCFDEAYIDFVDVKDYPSTLDYLKRGNVIVLRTFSKSYGMAGVRLGYGVATEEMVTYLNKVRQPFNINSLAQVAGIAALEDKAYLEKSRELVLKGREYLYSEFDNLGLGFCPSQANFVMVNIKKDADKIFEKLLKKGVIVRSMKAYQLPQWIRVTVGKQRDNKKFIRELKKLLK
jgi:histidinol-phosphate aminotransferase